MHIGLAGMHNWSIWSIEGVVIFVVKGLSWIKTCRKLVSPWKESPSIAIILLLAKSNFIRLLTFLNVSEPIFSIRLLFK